jgi:hypothetical protein
MISRDDAAKRRGKFLTEAPRHGGEKRNTENFSVFSEAP